METPNQSRPAEDTAQDFLEGVRAATVGLVVRNHRQYASPWEARLAAIQAEIDAKKVAKGQYNK